MSLTYCGSLRSAGHFGSPGILDRQWRQIGAEERFMRSFRSAFVVCAKWRRS